MSYTNKYTHTHTHTHTHTQIWTCFFNSAYPQPHLLQALSLSAPNPNPSLTPRLAETVPNVQCQVVCDASLTPWTAAHQGSLSLTISQRCSKVTSSESVMPPNPLILCHPLPFCLQSLPASGSFPRSQLFASGGHSIGASASALVLPRRIQD